jgi:AcrR family transcriptional regulator
VPADTAHRARRTPNQARSRALVERVVRAAARVFDERGYTAATTNHVAEAAGVSIGSLYQYFASKDELLVALAERHVDEVLPAVRARLADFDDAELPASAALRMLLDLAVQLNDSSRLHAVLYAEADRTPAIRASLAALDAELVRFVAAQIERAGTGGADPARRARLVVVAADAALHTVVLRLPPAARPEAVADLADVLSRGLAPER